MSATTRRLVAIMFTDVVGYSRLMAEDEHDAMELLHWLRGIIPALVRQSRGTLHKEIGDGTLSSFASAVDATRCACAIQTTIRGQRPDIALRIGLHVGDVIIEAGDVHGDGVNIAARLQSLAPTGGIALSDTVRMQIHGRLELPLRSLGHPKLKNITQALEVFACEAEDTGKVAAADALEVAPGFAGWWSSLRHRRMMAWALAVIVIAAIAATAVTWSARSPTVTAASQHRADTLLDATPASGTMPVPNSVVVLPFENPGGRAEDAYLSEGFGDELRDQLSRVAGLRVVARSSSVAFRDARIDSRAVARQLGVAVVIEGSLRKEGEALRLTVRLVDGQSGTQRWSEAYNRASGSLLAVQQEVALAAARAILPQISAADIPKPQWQASVHDLMLLARNYQQTALRPEDQDKVIELYRQVLERDPQSPSAHARLGRALLLRGTDLSASEQHLRRALSLDPKLAEAHASLGLLLWSQFRKGSGEMFRRALELNPNDADVLQLYAEFAGLEHREDMRRYLRRARELDPISLLINADLAGSYATAARLAEATEAMSVIEQRYVTPAGRLALGRITDTAGQLDEAIAWATEAFRLDPEGADAQRDLAERHARLGMRAAWGESGQSTSLRVLFWEQRYADMIGLMAARDLDEVDADSLGRLAFALQALGRDAEAVSILQGMGLPAIVLDRELRRIASVHHLATLIGSLEATGNIDEARRLATWLADFSDRLAPGEKGWAAPYWRACSHAVLGLRERALEEFEQSANAPNLAWLPLLADAACFRNLREEPRYRAALEQLKARHAELGARLPDTLARHNLPRTPG